MKRAMKCRRGVTAMLAMLYLVLFSTLALGFFASVTMSVQIAGNDQRMTRTRVAAESGMQFMKYQLGTLNIPGGTHPTQLFNAVYDRLSTKLNGYPNMGGNVVGLSAAGDVISIPSGANNWIKADGDGAEFRAEIENMGGSKLRTTVIGRYNGIPGTLGVELEYAVAQNASSIFDFGVASRSAIHLNSNARITGAGASNAALGSVLSTSMRMPTLDLDGNSEISGDVSFSSPGAQLQMDSNSKIAGLKTGQGELYEHIHYGVPEPEFPTVNTAAFAPYATNVLSVVGKKYTESSGILKNIRIKAGTNPEFDSNIEIKGIIYIETPNRVKFSSNTKITGAIVVQDDPTGDVTTNSILFSSNARILPIDTLPATADFPLGLRQLTGATILAPKFAVTFNSNFGSTGGSIIAGKMHFDSNAEGTVKGSVINLEDTMVQLDSNATITIESQGTSNYPAGVFFGSRFAPLPDTYREVRP